MKSPVAGYNEGKIREIITRLWSTKTGAEIAKELKKQGCVSKTGVPISSANVSVLAIKLFGLPRKVNTSAGAAGTSGMTTRRKRKRTRTIMNGHASPAYTQIEEVMTSNLDQKLKMRVLSMLLTGSDVR